MPKLRKKSVVSEKPSFREVKKWYDTHLHPDANDYNDHEVYKNVYHDGNFPGIFQCLEENTPVLTRRGYVSIRDVEPGEIVYCFNEQERIFEEKEVVNRIDKGVQDCIEIILSNGEKIECTADHEILTTSRGWIQAKDLNFKDGIVSISSKHYKSRFNCKTCGRLTSRKVLDLNFECRYCTQGAFAKLRFPGHLFDFSSFSVDKNRMKVIDKNGVVLPIKKSFPTACERCGDVYNASIVYERSKLHKWHCKSCAISLQWNDEKYRTDHVISLKKSAAKPEKKAKISRLSRRNWANRDIRKRMHGSVKSIKYVDPHGHNHLFRSSFELRFAKILDSSNLTWSYERDAFAVCNNTCVYIPDFHIKDVGFVEVKGYWRSEISRQKFLSFASSSTEPIALVRQDELKKLELGELKVENLFD